MSLCWPLTDGNTRVKFRFLFLFLFVRPRGAGYNRTTRHNSVWPAAPRPRAVRSVSRIFMNWPSCIASSINCRNKLLTSLSSLSYIHARHRLVFNFALVCVSDFVDLFKILLACIPPLCFYPRFHRVRYNDADTAAAAVLKQTEFPPPSSHYFVLPWSVFN